MSIWTSLNQFIRGGWRTYGLNVPDGPYAFDSKDNLYQSVSAEAALRLSAVWACMNLRAESIGTLPIQVRDANKNVLFDHPLAKLLKYSPNFAQTPAEYISQQVAHVDMHGNGYSIIHTVDNKIVSLEPIPDPANTVSIIQGSRLSNFRYDIGGDKFSPDEILHLKGFTLNNLMGLPRLAVGQCILAAQLTGNAYAQKSFQQGLKVGGFFKVEQNLDKTALSEFRARLDQYAQPENAGKWMALLKGMEPVGGAQFALKPGEAELLASRYFGIEEICRLFNCPPQLIGHSDKASSWASSLENINLFYLMYSALPTIIRIEQRMNKTLLTDRDRGRGVHVKFNIQGLLRGDTKTQMMFFASALQNGYFNRNEVRDLLDRAGIGAEGEQYLVQMNMAQAGDKLPQQEPA